MKVNKRKMKLPWELSSIFSEHPRIGAAQGAAADDEEEDEDHAEANEDSLKRLKVCARAPQLLTHRLLTRRRAA